MFNKQEILETVSASEDRLFISKVLDQALLSLKYHEQRYTSFLDPHQQKVLQKKLTKISDIGFHFWGGYKEAERKVLAVYPNYIYPEENQYPISILEISGRDLDGLSHRDLLGAILSLGIKREKIGDILIDDSKGYVFAISDICSYLLINLRKVKNCKVLVREIDDHNLSLPEKKFKEIRGTVASIRLDAVLSVALGMSRSKVLQYISSEKVSVNWELAVSASQMIKAGDVISIRGHGRMILDQVGGTTRKGRLNITVKRFI